MYGDPSYKLVASGSTAASANTAHSLFGAYQGLSLLIHEDDSIFIMLDAQTNDVRIGDSTVSNNRGVPILGSANEVQALPAMRMRYASQLHFANKTLGANGIINWNIWHRE
jgi:hypothetical protein